MHDTDSHLNELVRLAIRSGASKAAIIPTNAISAEEKLAELCRKPRCKNYGLSHSCPPHVSGPAGFRNYLKTAKYAIVIRIDLPQVVLFSEQRWEIMYLLHQIAAGLETAAVQSGFTGAKAFAGGSCKQIFCREEKECGALSAKGKCRHPETARPSMSGFGINVSRLMQAAGWSSTFTTQPPDPGDASMSWVAGLIVIG